MAPEKIEALRSRVVSAKERARPHSPGTAHNDTFSPIRPYSPNDSMKSTGNHSFAQSSLIQHGAQQTINDPRNTIWTCSIDGPFHAEVPRVPVTTGSTRSVRRLTKQPLLCQKIFDEEDAELSSKPEAASTFRPIQVPPPSERSSVRSHQQKPQQVSGNSSRSGCLIQRIFYPLIMVGRSSPAVSPQASVNRPAPSLPALHIAAAVKQVCT